MIELFDNPREDKKSDRPAPKSLVKFRQIYQDAMAGAGEEKTKPKMPKENLPPESVYLTY